MTWAIWIQKHWKEMEPAMRKALRDAFGKPLYTDEFDDITQEFVAYLLTRTDPDPFEGEFGESQKYLLCQWVVRRGMTMRAKEDHYEALPDDFDMEAPDEEDPDEEETTQRIARCERVLQKKCSHPLTMGAWELCKEGVGCIEIAERLGVSYPTVTTLVRNIKRILREEFPEDVYVVYGGKSLRKVA